MPMSPRLLRPRASAALVAVDADARAYINAVRIADGGQYMEPTVQLAIDAFVTGCKTDGIWSAIKASCILMGARTLSGALTPLVGSAPTNNGPFVSGDYNRKTGLVGNGSSKFLNSGRANNADAQDSQHIAVYVSSVTTTSRSYAGAGGSSSGRSSFGISNNTSTLFIVSRQITSSSFSGGTTGFVGMSRQSGTSVSILAGGTSGSITQASQSPTSDAIYVFARNNGSNTAETYTDARISFYSIGEALTLATLDSRVTTLYNAIGAAIP